MVRSLEVTPGAGAVQDGVEVRRSKWKLASISIVVMAAVAVTIRSSIGASLQSNSGHVHDTPVGTMNSIARVKSGLRGRDLRVVLEKGIAHELGSYTNWAKALPARSDAVIQPMFMLRRTEEAREKLERTLYEVSMPGGARFGRYLSLEEVKQLAPPVEGSKSAVLRFLQEHEVPKSSIEIGDDWVRAKVPVHLAEVMFETTFHTFVHIQHGDRISAIRASMPYSVPSYVADALYMVGGLAQLPAMPTRPKVQKQPASPAVNLTREWPHDCGKRCREYTTPGVLKKAYNAPEKLYGNNVSMAIVQFQGVSYNQHLLYEFQHTCKLPFTVIPAHLEGYNDAYICENFVGEIFEICLESLLDIDYAKAMSTDIPLTVIGIEDYNLLYYGAYLNNLTNPPHIQSVSYGNDEFQQISQNYTYAVNDQFIKAALRGVSVLFASGDQGVWGREGAGDVFHADFPASSPFVTAVGGTNFVHKSKIGEEEAWDGSGGGFSDYFPRPAYQEQAVKGYLELAGTANKLPDADKFNRTGRAYPDISALGGVKNAYCVATHLLWKTLFAGVGGTSASSPTVAGLFARINAVRNSAGLPPMGFLNPFIYQNPNVFNDVKQGVNWNDGSGNSTLEGFEAMEGWDPATGMGTPNYLLMEAAALQWAPGKQSVVKG